MFSRHCMLGKKIIKKKKKGKSISKIAKSISRTAPATGIAICALHKTQPRWGWWKQYGEHIAAARSEHGSSLLFKTSTERQLFSSFFLPAAVLACIAGGLAEELQDVARARAATAQHLWRGAMYAARTRGCSLKSWVQGWRCLLYTDIKSVATSWGFITAASP